MSEKNSGQDLFWADGYNLNLMRNHILYYRKELEELLYFPEKVKGEVMERLTSNKNVSEMNLLELAQNCVYVKDGWCRYRDYETDIDLVDLAAKLSKQLGGHIVTADGNGEKEDISDELWDNLQYGFSTIDGLVAFIYTRLVALGQMQNVLKAYEDLAEQGKLLKLPCAVGDTVYTLHTLPSRKTVIGEIEIDSFMCVLGMLEGRFGKTIFLTKEQAEAALKEMEENQ